MSNLETDITREPDWTDLRVPMSSLAAVTGAGLKAPTFKQLSDNGAGSTGLYASAYSPTQEQELMFTAQLPHSYTQGSDVEPHIHWSPSDTANTGNVVWGIELTWTNIGDLIANSTITTITVAVDGAGTRNVMSDFPLLDGTGKLISGQYHGRIFRDATNVLDTYPDDAFVLEFDFHFQQNSLGSDTEHTKG